MFLAPLLSFNVEAFTQSSPAFSAGTKVSGPSVTSTARSMSFADDFLQDSPDSTKERIQDLVDDNPGELLFVFLIFIRGGVRQIEELDEKKKALSMSFVK